MYYIINRLLTIKSLKGQVTGPAISDIEGKLLTTKAMDDMLHEALKEIFSERPALFPLTIDDLEKIPKNYQCFRTLRRT